MINFWRKYWCQQQWAAVIVNYASGACLSLRGCFTGALNKALLKGPLRSLYREEPSIRQFRKWMQCCSFREVALMRLSNALDKAWWMRFSGGWSDKCRLHDKHSFLNNVRFTHQQIGYEKDLVQKEGWDLMLNCLQWLEAIRVDDIINEEFIGNYAFHPGWHQRNLWPESRLRNCLMVNWVKKKMIPLGLNIFVAVKYI